MKKKLPLIIGATAGLLLGFSATDKAEACNIYGLAGTVCFVAAPNCPHGYAQANGQIVSAKAYGALKAAYGEDFAKDFGGDGITTIGIPDLRGRSLVGTYPPGKGNDYKEEYRVAVGQKRGSEQATLKLTDIAPHTHSVEKGEVVLTGTLRANDTGADSVDPTGKYLAGKASSVTPNFRKSSADVKMRHDVLTGSLSMGETSSVGQGQPFSIMGPRLGLTACVMLDTAVKPKKK